MKATLSLENGMCFTAQITEEEGVSLMLTLVNMAKKNTHENTGENAISDAKQKAAQAIEKDNGERYRLFCVRCEACGKDFVKKVYETQECESFNCRCGAEIKIETTNTASGNCPNCASVFYNIQMVNGLKEVTCRKCQSRIDLFEKKDGMYGT